MSCEIEFLAVGDASRAGDAIIVRYGSVNDYKLMVVDGGTSATGEKMVAHLKKHFGEGVVLEHVVLTHSDNDHASGLREVLGQIPVKNLWLHVPWLHADETLHLFQNKNWTQERLAAAIKNEYDIIAELVELAHAHNCTVYEPFQGDQIGPFAVASPSRYAYNHLLPQFDKTPVPDQEVLEGLNFWLGKQSGGTFGMLFEKAFATVQSWITESWENERLKDGGVTSASNESSLVLHADTGDGERVLLTGDAGVNALTWAANYAEATGRILANFTFVQIPHHGSRRNVGPSVLNRLLGSIKAIGTTSSFSAFVSAPVDDASHPRKIVLNAFMRRGGSVIPTQGTNKIYYGGFPARDGYSTATPETFSTQVEDYD